MNRQEISVLAAFIITFIFSVLSGQLYEAQQIKSDTLRLHIIANSNSLADQQNKLYIRDEILAMEDLLPVNATSYGQAAKELNNSIDEIEQRVNEVLKKKNIGYTARCSVEEFYFDTTQYNNFVLPQGRYTAFTVRLGNAEGNNWWCVMYPALCSSLAAQAEENSSDFILTDKLKPRFKVVEIYEDIKNFFTENNTKVYKNIG